MLRAVRHCRKVAPRANAARVFSQSHAACRPGAVPIKVQPSQVRVCCAAAPRRARFPAVASRRYFASSSPEGAVSNSSLASHSKFLDLDGKCSEADMKALLGVGIHDLYPNTNEHRKAMERLLPLNRIRNFCIIAHVDHGKSTLADCLLRITGNLGAAGGHDQDDVASSTSETPSLDNLEVERERGITVKAQTASMFVKYKGEFFLLNLIDTPGHVDFSFEVNRSLAVCEGCLLLIDSAQGIQAQTLAVFEGALEAGLDIVPVLTKMDLDSSQPRVAVDQLESALGLDAADVIYCSAKTATGVRDIIPAIIERIESPEARARAPASAAEALLLQRRQQAEQLARKEGRVRLDSSAEAAGDPEVAELEAVVKKVSADVLVEPSLEMRLLLFDSWYDVHRGVICLVYLASGVLYQGTKVTSYYGAAPLELDVGEVGIVTPVLKATGMLRRGQVGYIIAGIKNPKDAVLGDTFFPVSKKLPKHLVAPLAGFVPAKSMVYAGIYGTSSSEFEELKKAVDRLTLNDGSVEITQESSDALGQGFRCGFRGMLAMDVWCQRLEQEFGASVIITAPTVPFKVVLKEAFRDSPKYKGLYLQSAALTARLSHGSSADDGLSTERHEDPTGKLSTVSEAMLEEQGALIVTSAEQWPEEPHLHATYEPVVMSTVLSPADCLGPMMQLFEHHRGNIIEMTYITTERVLLKYLMPLSEVVTRFYFKVQTISSGFASFDFVPAGYMHTHLLKLELRLNNKPVDALSVICPQPVVETRGRALSKRLKKVLDRQQYEIVIQAVCGSKILARERIAPYRKDVLVKSGKLVGGGDMTRKTKLLEKQKKGKKRMKSIGNVEVNQEAFLAVISVDE